MNIPVLAFVGSSNSGKTTLLTRVVHRLSQQGYRVAVVKHHHHRPQLDTPGKDTYRYAEAGAQVVVSASADLTAYLEYRPEPPLAAILERITDVDIILLEGFKWEPLPKVEVIRRENRQHLICDPGELKAIVGDLSFPELDLPQFDIDDVEGVTRWLVASYLNAS